MGGPFHKRRYPRRCYVVCAIPRSGSNLLTDGLRATRRAGRPQQFFLPGHEAKFALRNGLDATDFAAYVRGIISATATPNEVFGFKLMGGYLEGFLQRLRATRAFGEESEVQDLEILRTAFPRLQFIQIARRNKIRQAVSKARAAQTGLWKIGKGKSASGEPQFDSNLISSCLEDTRREEMIWDRFFERIEVKPFRVEYEELSENYAGTVAATLDFLKIRAPSRERIRPITVRQADALSRDWEKRFLALAPLSH